MNKKIFITTIFFLLFSASATFAEQAAAVDNEAEAKKSESDTASGTVLETAKQAAESQSIIEQTMAAEVDSSSSAAGSSAQEKAIEKTKAWIPSAIDYDWVQLTSNEWLKGEVKGMYRDNLEFDSDKLKLLDIKWKDVKILRSHRVNNVNIEDVGATHGVLEVTDQNVHIINDYGTEEFNRSQLVSFAPGGKSEGELWAIKATLSLDLKQGNTDQLDYTAKVNIKRRASRTRFIMDYIGNISKTNGGKGSLIETVNNHRISANFDYYKTRYFFYNPVFAELFRDPFLNIDLRTTLGTGLGYTLIDDGKTELSFSGGPAFVKTDFISVTDGEKNSQTTAAAVLRADYDTELTNTLDFIAKYNIQIANTASGGYSHHAIATLESELTSKLDLDVSLIWDRVNSPTKNADGNVPESNDFRLTVGVTYTY